MFKTKKTKALPEINTTSLPDIIFMLLFYFMVVTVLRKDKTSPVVDVPRVTHAELMKNEEIIALSLISNKESYTYQLGKNLFQELTALEAALSEKKILEGDKNVKILADKLVPMKSINEVKTALQKANYSSIEYLVTTNS